MEVNVTVFCDSKKKKKDVKWNVSVSVKLEDIVAFYLITWVTRNRRWRTRNKQIYVETRKGKNHR